MSVRRASPTPPALSGVLLLTIVAAALITVWAPVAAEQGWESCAACHEESLVAHFGRTTHGRIAAWEAEDGVVGCAGCHGPTGAHVNSGDPADIRGLKGEDPEDISPACTKCHSGRHLAAWPGSEHHLSGVGCTDCHRIHASGEGKEPKLRSPETCYQCHHEVRAQVMLPSRHPIMEGKMTCLSCHEPHGSFLRGIKTEERVNDLCFKCHSRLQGPFVFEHPPAVEDCSGCHSPHGSVANNLLKQNEPFLCLQCHEFHFHAAQDAIEEDSAVIGDPAGTYGNPYRTFGYKVAFTTKCTQCHHQIHGSDLPSQSTPGQGKAFTR